MAKVEAKQVVVNEIKEKLSKAASVVVVDARGLTVEQDTQLRKSLREAGVDYKVYKNTMMTLAVKDTQFEGLAQYLLKNLINLSLKQALSRAQFMTLKVLKL